MMLAGLLAGTTWAQSVLKGECPEGYTTMATFGFQANEQTFVVPTGVTSIHITAYGASGGNSLSDSAQWGKGGFGGAVSGFLTVTPGETLYIYTGQQGRDGDQTATNGSFNGGGSGGYSGGDGGGATDVRRGGNAENNRILVAGGGGGAGGLGCTGAVRSLYGGNGGHSGAAGSHGKDSLVNASLITGGQGGQVNAGGAAGIGCGSFPGGAGTVPHAGLGPTFNACVGGQRLANGGGGGGGYQAGGGGGGGAVGTTGCATNVSTGGGGGAGGTNYIDAVFTNTTNADGFLEGNGYVKICYTPTVAISPLAQMGISVSPNPTSGMLRINSNTEVKMAEIFAADGRLLISRVAPEGALDLSELPAGIYTLRLQTAVGVGVTQVVRN